MSSMQTMPQDSDQPESTEWIADATRRLAGLTPDGPSAPGTDSPRGVEALTRLRSSIASRVARLPRSARLVHSASQHIELTELALSRAMVVGLASAAAAEGAVIADVELGVTDHALTRLRINLVAVGAEERPRTLLQGGAALRGDSAALLRQCLGDPGEVSVDIDWTDVLADEGE